MHERMSAARGIEVAIVHSDLDRAHAEAGALTTLDEPDALETWRPFLERVTSSAHEVEIAPDVVAAARAMAKLGRECARCHEAIAAKIAFPEVPRPADDPKLRPQMLAHQWAASRMWEGLIGPSENRWLDGAQALTEARLTIVAEDDSLPNSNKIGDDIARVRLYANRAVALHDQDARTDLYGELLATCAHCHAAIRDR